MILLIHSLPYCPGDDAVIEVFPNGGVGAEMISQGSTSDIDPYTYEWAHIGSTASQIMNPEDTTTYSVTVTDVCGFIEQASVEVFVTQYDRLFANADRTYVCEDTLAQICVIAEEEKEITPIYGQTKLQLNVLRYFTKLIHIQ